MGNNIVILSIMTAYYSIFVLLNHVSCEMLRTHNAYDYGSLLSAVARSLEAGNLPRASEVATPGTVVSQTRHWRTCHRSSPQPGGDGGPGVDSCPVTTPWLAREGRPVIGRSDGCRPPDPSRSPLTGI